MRAWITKAIIGGLWGLISGIFAFFMAIGTAMAEGSLIPQTVGDLLITSIIFILFLPGYLSLFAFLIFFKIFGRVHIPFTNFDTFILVPVLSIVLGIIIINLVISVYNRKVKNG